jgi:hypothetical protein
MYRLWRQERLQVPKKRRRRVSASRPRPQTRTTVSHVWAYDFVFDTCADGRILKCLTVIDEFTRECPWQNRTDESFNGKFRDQHLSRQCARRRRRLALT